MIQQLDYKKLKQAVILNLMEKLKTNQEIAFEIDDNGNTLLHHVVRYDGAKDLIVSLVKCGINLKAKNHQGNTPLHIAAAHSAENVILLMRLGAKDNVINNDALFRGYIAFNSKIVTCFYNVWSIFENIPSELLHSTNIGY
jgi:ankyrin repeat protein